MVAANAEQIRQHLCYELKWMLRAVVRFEEITGDVPEIDALAGAPLPHSDAVAFQDSALLHARNLVEFAKASSDPDDEHVEWALTDILGAHRRKVPASLRTFLNNWVTNIGTQTTAVQWPSDTDGNGIDGDDHERLSKVTKVVLKLLRPKHRTTTLETPEGKAYIEILDQAHEYFERRTPEAFAALTCSGPPKPAKKRGKKKASET